MESYVAQVLSRSSARHLLNGHLSWKCHRQCRLMGSAAKTPWGAVHPHFARVHFSTSEGHKAEGRRATPSLFGSSQRTPLLQQSPQLNFGPEQAVLQFFLKWTYFWGACSLLGLSGFSGSAFICGAADASVLIVAAFGYPLARCISNYYHSVRYLEVCTDAPSLEATPRIGTASPVAAPTPLPPTPVPTPASGSGGRKRGRITATAPPAEVSSSTAVVDPGKERSAALESLSSSGLQVMQRPDTNVYDPWAHLKETEVLGFNHFFVTPMRQSANAFRVDFSDVEWLAFETALDSTGTETHLWRLLKVRHVKRPYNVFVSARMDPVIPSIVALQPTLKLLEVRPKFDWDKVPVWGWEVVSAVEPTAAAAAATATSAEQPKATGQRSKTPHTPQQPIKEGAGNPMKKPNA
eukprot:RCo016408